MEKKRGRPVGTKTGKKAVPVNISLTVEEKALLAELGGSRWVQAQLLKAATLKASETPD